MYLILKFVEEAVQLLETANNAMRCDGTNTCGVEVKENVELLSST